MILEIAIWLSRLTVFGYIAALVMLLHLAWMIQTGSNSYALAWFEFYAILCIYPASLLLNRVAARLRDIHWSKQG